MDFGRFGTFGDLWWAKHYWLYCVLVGLGAAATRMASSQLAAAAFAFLTGFMIALAGFVYETSDKRDIR